MSLLELLRAPRGKDRYKRLLNVEQLNKQGDFLAIRCQKQLQDFFCQLTGSYSSTEEVDEEVVGEAGEVVEVGDAEERGVEGEGEQGGGAHRRQIWISRPLFYNPHASVASKARATLRPLPRSSSSSLPLSLFRLPAIEGPL